MPPMIHQTPTRLACVCVRMHACGCMCLTVVGSAMLRRRTHTRRSSHSRAAHRSHCTHVIGVMGTRLTAPGANGGSPSRCARYVRQQDRADSARHDILIPQPAEKRRSPSLCHWGGCTCPSACVLACLQSVALGRGRACSWQRCQGCWHHPARTTHVCINRVCMN